MVEEQRKWRTEFHGRKLGGAEVRGKKKSIKEYKTRLQRYPCHPVTHFLPSWHMASLWEAEDKLLELFFSLYYQGLGMRASSGLQTRQ